MSEHKFTPGPWLVDPDDRPGMDWNTNIVEALRPHMRICFMASDGPNEANARLIAVSPKLYALAVKVAAHFDGTDAPLGIEARDVIAEATTP